MRFTPGLRALTLATVVALVGVSALTAPVAAIDPAATPAATSTASATPTPTSVPTPTPDPAASATPTPDPSAAPTPTPTASSSPDPTPTPTPTPTATPTPTPTPVPPAKPNLGVRVVRVALAQRHKRYVMGASGPSAFDCSGLVRYAYRKAGVGRDLGGGHSAWAMLHWARAHHLASRSHPHVGDVVIYGNGTHAAIYIGHGLVVSALNPRQGIRVTGLYAVGARFTAFIHTRL